MVILLMAVRGMYILKPYLAILIAVLMCVL